MIGTRNFWNGMTSLNYHDQLKIQDPDPSVLKMSLIPNSHDEATEWKYSTKFKAAKH